MNSNAIYVWFTWQMFRLQFGSRRKFPYQKTSNMAIFQAEKLERFELVRVFGGLMPLG